jgi:hypothetical protein
VDSGWSRTWLYDHRKGPNSWVWHAKVTFEVPGPYPAVFIATDYGYVDTIPVIYDSTGTTVGVLAVSRPG